MERKRPASRGPREEPPATRPRAARRSAPLSRSAYSHVSSDDDSDSSDDSVPSDDGSTYSIMRQRWERDDRPRPDFASKITRKMLSQPESAPVVSYFKEWYERHQKDIPYEEAVKFVDLISHMRIPRGKNRNDLWLRQLGHGQFTKNPSYAQTAILAAIFPLHKIRATRWFPEKWYKKYRMTSIFPRQLPEAKEMLKEDPEEAPEEDPEEDSEGVPDEALETESEGEDQVTSESSSDSEADGRESDGYERQYKTSSSDRRRRTLNSEATSTAVRPSVSLDDALEERHGFPSSKDSSATKSSPLSDLRNLTEEMTDTAETYGSIQAPSHKEQIEQQTHKSSPSGPAKSHKKNTRVPSNDGISTAGNGPSDYGGLAAKKISITKPVAVAEEETDPDGIYHSTPVPCPKRTEDEPQQQAGTPPGPGLVEPQPKASSPSQDVSNSTSAAGRSGDPEENTEQSPAQQDQLRQGPEMPSEAGAPTGPAVSLNEKNSGHDDAHHGLERSRLTDCLSEIARQNALLPSLLLGQLDNQAREISRLETENSELKSDVKELKSSYNALESRFAACLTKLEENATEFARLRNTHTANHDMLNKGMKSLHDEVRHNKKSSEDANTSIVNDLTAMKKKVTDVTTLGQQHTTELAALKDQVDEAEAVGVDNGKAFQEQLDSMASKVKTVEESIGKPVGEGQPDNEQTVYERLSAQTAEVTSLQSQVEQFRKDHQKSASTLDGKLDKVAEELPKLHGKIDELVKDFDETKKADEKRFKRLRESVMELASWKIEDLKEPDKMPESPVSGFGSRSSDLDATL